MKISPEEMLKIKDIELVSQVFEKYNVKFLIAYGVLLGLHRDGHIIPHDDDCDFIIIDKVDYKTRKAIGWMLYDLGFQPQPIMFNVFGRMEMAEIGYNGDAETGIYVFEKNFKFSLFWMKEEDCPLHGKEYVCTPKMGAMKLISCPAKFLEKTDTIKMNGKKYFTPSPIADFLKHNYNDWKDHNGRDHAKLYLEAHPEHQEILKDVMKNNSTVIWKNK